MKINKLLTSVFLILFVNLNIQAVTIDVGGVKIDIPEPDNYSLVVPEMSELFELQKGFVAPSRHWSCIIYT